MSRGESVKPSGRTSPSAISKRPVSIGAYSFNFVRTLPFLLSVTLAYKKMGWVILTIF
jgi:hypothetical protein